MVNKPKPDLPPKPKRKGDVSYVVEFDMEEMDFFDFIWTENHNPPLIVKPENMKQDGEE